MKYKAIRFDFGGVIHGNPGFVFDQGVCRLLGINLEEYRQAYFAHNAKLNNGLASQVDIWKLVLYDLKQPHMLEPLLKFIDDSNSHKEYNQQVIELIKNLRILGYKLGLLSNNTPETAAKLRSEDFDSLFDSFLISSEIGVSKPSKEAFELLANNLSVSLSELVFIDDSEKSLSTSEECNFTPILFTTYEELVQDLIKLGVLGSLS